MSIRALLVREFQHGLSSVSFIRRDLARRVDQNFTPYSNAAKIRQLFVIPNAAEREFFYGVNFEISYAMPQFSDAQWNLEIRPIVGWRKNDYEFILNPIVDIGFGQNGGAVFAPAARF